MCSNSPLPPWRSLLLALPAASGAARAAQSPGWLHRPAIFGLGVIAGVLAVTIGRGLMRLRAPRRSAQLPARPGPAPVSISAGTPAWRELAARTTAPVVTAPGSAGSAGQGGEPQGHAPGLRIGVLGQLTINGQPGALLPAQAQLIVALALHGDGGLANRRLCQFLGPDPAHPKPADSLRQLIARTRRQLGPAADGGEWIEHRGHGQYALHPDSRLDWQEFEALTADGIGSGDARRLATALGMIRGQPFTGCYYWWLDIELVERVCGQIVAAAMMLAELSLASQDPAGAARAARIGLVADSTSEELWRALMRAEHAAGNLAGVREAWSRCSEAVAEIAADGRPEGITADLYRELLGG